MTGLRFETERLMQAFYDQRVIGVLEEVLREAEIKRRFRGRGDVTDEEMIARLADESGLDREMVRGLVYGRIR